MTGAAVARFSLVLMDESSAGYGVFVMDRVTGDVGLSGLVLGCLLVAEY